MRNFSYVSCCADRDLPLNSLSSYMYNTKCGASNLSAQYLLCSQVLSSHNSTSKYTHHQNNHCRQLPPWRSGYRAWIRYSVTVRLFCSRTPRFNGNGARVRNPSMPLYFQESDKTNFGNVLARHFIIQHDRLLCTIATVRKSGVPAWLNALSVWS